jgi:hypothetical protein
LIPRSCISSFFVPLESTLFQLFASPFSCLAEDAAFSTALCHRGSYSRVASSGATSSSFFHVPSFVPGLAGSSMPGTRTSISSAPAVVRSSVAFSFSTSEVRIRTSTSLPLPCRRARS